MENFTARQKFIIAGIFIILLAIGYFFLQYKMKSDIVISSDVQTVKQEDAKETEEVQLPKEIVVHVCGYVANPGIVKLPEGSRVNDAIEKAGGILKGADLNSLNLASILSDGEKVYVAKIGETNNNISGSKPQNNVININSADLDELDLIPGIGPATASKIIDYRKRNGRFKKIEDIKNISGIGEKKFESIKKYIAI